MGCLRHRFRNNFFVIQTFGPVSVLMGKNDPGFAAKNCRQLLGLDQSPGGGGRDVIVAFPPPMFEDGQIFYIILAKLDVYCFLTIRLKFKTFPIQKENDSLYNGKFRQS
jgi:hypothetical protein